MSINVSVHLWRGDPAEIRSASTESGCYLEMQTFTEDGWPAGELSLHFRKPEDICDLAERILREGMALQDQFDRANWGDPVAAPF